MTNQIPGSNSGIENKSSSHQENRQRKPAKHEKDSSTETSRCRQDKQDCKPSPVALTQRQEPGKSLHSCGAPTNQPHWMREPTRVTKKQVQDAGRPEDEKKRHGEVQFELQPTGWFIQEQLSHAKAQRRKGTKKLTTSLFFLGVFAPLREINNSSNHFHCSLRLVRLSDRAGLFLFIKRFITL
jgi:hypothetical protein